MPIGLTCQIFIIDALHLKKTKTIMAHFMNKLPIYYAVFLSSLSYPCFDPNLWMLHFSSWRYWWIISMIAVHNSTKITKWFTRGFMRGEWGRGCHRRQRGICIRGGTTLRHRATRVRRFRGEILKSKIIITHWKFR